MTPERWQKVNELFTAVVELEPAARSAFLDQTCSDDQNLRSEVESLLASDDRGWDVIERPALEVAAPLLANEQPQLTPGETFSHYEIVGLAGKGGMGEVYLAKDKLLNRRIALKLLPFDYTRHKDRLRRFQQEAQAASALNHPNILTIHELGEFHGEQFIATEFVEGETLRERLRKSQLSVEESLDIAIQLCSALSAAHRAGIVHRDIKPENIMLRHDGYVKVLDFGLAKLIGEYGQRIKMENGGRVDVSSGLVMGTIKYMSPEQAQGDELDLRSDIFAVGIVLYEMLTGRTPFKGEDGRQILKSIIADLPPPLTNYVRNASNELQLILNKSLSKEKTDRYQRAEELLSDLRALREKRPSMFTRARAQLKQHKAAAGLALVAFVIMAVGCGFAIQKFFKSRTPPFQNITLAKVTNFNDAWSPAISPDGTYMVYAKTHGTEESKFSLWLKGVGSSNETQIVPLTEGHFNSASFSPDGKSVYYSARLTNQLAAFVISLSGGNATRLPLISQRPRQVIVSPDGKRLAFLNSKRLEAKSSVVIANADGTNEQEIVSRQEPNYFWDVKPSWSPDGKLIACVGQDGTEGFPRVFEINVGARTERPLTTQKWSTLAGVEWLPDMSGLLVVGAEETSSFQQIWRISYESGEAQRVTNDTTNYSGVNLTSDGKTLITSRVDAQTSIGVMPVERRQSTFLITDAREVNVANLAGTTFFETNFARLSWAPDGRIIYMSEESGNADIWSMNSDGSDRKQLTTDSHWDVGAGVSPDNRYIAFMSNRAGSENIWIMNIDGRNQRRLTKKSIERVPDFSADSKWVFFDSWQTGKETIWKVPVAGGEPIQVVSDLSDLQSVSPDGRFLAYIRWSATNPRSMRLFIAPTDGGPPLKSLDVNGYEYYWVPNGRSLTFRSNRDGVFNLWEESLDGHAPRQLTHFTSEGVLTHAWSRDGKQLAVLRNKVTSDIVLIRDVK
jgi:serine/threonine protein kinase